MSHKATSWAIGAGLGLGLTAGAKLVLFHLADRHNPDLGCFPSQERLRADCEVSRSQLNIHLGALEAAGLIRRVRQLDPKTRQQKPTRYMFAFEDDFVPVTPKPTAGADQAEMPLAKDEPCPENGHGKTGNPVSDLAAIPCPIFGQSRVRPAGHKPVREPVRESIVRGVADEHTIGLFEMFWEGSARPRDKDRSMRLFAEAAARGVDLQWIIASAKRYRTENIGNKPMYLVYSDNWLEAERWRDYDQPRQGGADLPGSSGPDLAKMFAQKIKQKCYVAPSAIGHRLAAEIIGRGLATEAELRSAGFRA